MEGSGHRTQQQALQNLRGAGTSKATEAVLERLKALNDAYLERFGFIFIVCATGKSAAEMLALLEARIESDRATELATAAREQEAIMALRLEQALDEDAPR